MPLHAWPRPAGLGAPLGLPDQHVVFKWVEEVERRAYELEDVEAPALARGLGVVDVEGGGHLLVMARLQEDLDHALKRQSGRGGAAESLLLLGCAAVAVHRLGINAEISSRDLKCECGRVQVQGCVG